MLWVGWYGFNPGSTHGMTTITDLEQASNAVLTTTVAGSAGGVAAVLVSRSRALWVAWRKGLRAGHTEVDVMHLSNGILSGLVAITAGCDIVSPANALIIGLVAGGSYPLCSHIIGPVLHIDDVVDAVAVHLCGGAWGVIAVGLFHHKLGLVATGSIALLKTQCFGCLVLALTAGVLIFPVLFLINSLGFLRVSVEIEAKGLDSKFGISAHVHDSAKLLRLKEARDVIVNYGFDIEDLLLASSRERRWRSGSVG